MDHIGAVVVVTQGAVIGVDNPGEDCLGTLLHTTKTALTGVEVLGFLHATRVFGLFLEDSVDTLLFHTFFTASGAVFPEFYRGVFTEWFKPRCGCLRMNVILFGHEASHFN
jgi:hypothetical protein